MAPPTISITSPTENSEVGNNFLITATASDDIAVVGVQFRIDGVDYGMEVTSEPWQINWDTSLFSDGTHVVTAIARDGDSNLTNSQSVSCIVANGSMGGGPVDFSVEPVGLAYRELVNIKPVGSEGSPGSTYEYVTIPGPVGDGSYEYRLTQLPLNVPIANPQSSIIECREVDANNIELDGPIRLTAINQFGSLIQGTFVIKTGTLDSDDALKFGKITFSKWDAGRRFKVMYTGRGSLVYAEDILNLNRGLSLLPNTIRPGHISNLTNDNFFFPGDVNIYGDLNIVGVVNRVISETVNITDDVLLMNSNATAPGPDVSFVVNRGGANPSITWQEDLDSWTLFGTSDNWLFRAYDTGLVEFGGPIKLKSYTESEEAALLVSDNIPSMYYCSTDRQVKAIVDDGSGNPTIRILG